MSEASNLTGELSCVLTLLVNFPLSKKYPKLVHTKYFLEWSTDFTKGCSGHIKVDAKGIDVDDSFLFLY
jgi:hypothetical protein